MDEMNETPVRNSQSADNNNMNDTNSSNETSAMIVNTSLTPPAAATPPLPTNGQQNNDNNLNESTSGWVVGLTGFSITLATPAAPLPTGNGQQSNGQQNNGPEIVANRPILVAKRRLTTGSTPTAPLIQAPSELPPSATPFSDWDKFMARYSIVIYALDVGSDVYLVGKHSFNHDWWYLGFTLLFVLLPSLVMTFIMRRWYDEWHYGNQTVPSINPARNIYIRHLMTWTQLGPFQRYREILDHGLKSRDTARSSRERCEHLKEVYYKKLEMSRLRLIDTFMESAPQLVLQVYILAKTSTQSPDICTIIFDWVPVLTSLAALSSALVNYEVAPYMDLVRFKSQTAQRNYVYLKIEEYIFNFIWRLLTIMARVLALALFSSVFPFYLGPACFVNWLWLGIGFGHWLIMFAWVIFITLNLEHLIINNQIDRNQCTKLADFKCKHYRSGAYLAYVLTFCYHDSCGKLTGQQVIYYIVMFIENCALLGLWYAYCPTGLWYTWIALYTHFGSFFLGLIIMGVYYIRLDRRTLYVPQVANATEPWWNIWAHAKLIARILLSGDTRLSQAKASGPDNSESSEFYVKLYLQPNSSGLASFRVQLPRNLNLNGCNIIS